MRDDNIPKADKMTQEDYQWLLYEGKFSGFNFIFGNVNDTEEGYDGAGKLMYYQNTNQDPKEVRRPVQLRMRKAHGISNGDLDKWAKVVHGRYDFFKVFLKAEDEVLKFKDDKEKIQHYMAQFSDDIHQVMLNDVQMSRGQIQVTDYPWYDEKLWSSVFTRNGKANFATVST